MKKFLMLAAFAVVTMSLASCKRDWNCKCTSSGGGVSASAEYSFNATKKDAEEACDGYAATSSAGGTSVSTTCELSKK